MSKVHARAVFSPEGPFDLTAIDRRDPQPHDVEIEIKYAGICHSDIHTARGEWGPVQYPLVPGHEIAGIVTKIGAEVTKYSVGDRVGVGCMVDSCGKCVNCAYACMKNPCSACPSTGFFSLPWDLSRRAIKRGTCCRKPATVFARKLTKIVWRILRATKVRSTGLVIY